MVSRHPTLPGANTAEKLSAAFHSLGLGEVEARTASLHCSSMLVSSSVSTPFRSTKTSRAGRLQTHSWLARPAFRLFYEFLELFDRESIQ